MTRNVKRTGMLLVDVISVYQQVPDTWYITWCHVTLMFTDYMFKQVNVLLLNEQQNINNAHTDEFVCSLLDIMMLNLCWRLPCHTTPAEGNHAGL